VKVPLERHPPPFSCNYYVTRLHQKLHLLSDLLDLPSRPLISIVGAGGKTTTMYTLARELAQRGRRVITTTTTNIYVPTQRETDTLIIGSETSALVRMVSAAWQQGHCRVTVGRKAVDRGKLAGLGPDQPYELLVKSGADVVVVEADGARHKMIKAPADHEPVMPFGANVVLLMMSVEAINRPLSGEVAHRPESVAAVLGMSQGDILTPARVARLMMSEEGGMKNVPEGARVYVLIAHVGESGRGEVREVAEMVRGSGKVPEVFCSSQSGECFSI
jgi:probable selenium-dependent hydroxylase accessory protein YqeC